MNQQMNTILLKYGGRNVHFWLIGPSLPNPPLYTFPFIKISASQPTHIFIRNHFGRSHKTRISPSPDNFRYPTVCSFIYLFLHLLLIIFTFFTLLLQITGANLASTLKEMKENNSYVQSLVG